MLQSSDQPNSLANIKTFDDVTPLMIASSRHDQAMMRVLLLHDAEVNARSKYGQAAVHAILPPSGTTTRAAVEMLQILVDYSLNVHTACNRTLQLVQDFKQEGDEWQTLLGTMVAHRLYLLAEQLLDSPD